MIASTATFGTKQYSLLGKLLLQKEPEVAQRLISTYLPSEQPIEQDYSKIKGFFIAYCQVQNLEPEDYRGSLYKTSKVDVRRLFVAVILHMYAPQLYTQPVDSLILNKGLVKNLCEVLGQAKSNISVTIREVVTWEKNYQDFAEAVENVINQIRKHGAEG